MKFEELDYRDTSIGELSLRRRWSPALNTMVYEIKLGHEYLMTSYFTEAERALGEIGVAERLRRLSEVNTEKTRGLDVVVGGLGLGYTARAVLQAGAVGSLLVIELLPAVIEWHISGLLPLGPELTGDERCRFSEGDFFARAASSQGFDEHNPGRRFDVVLVDIDHTPDHFLDNGHDVFYREEGLRRAARHLLPGGVFGLWSNDPPDARFTSRLERVFPNVSAEPITFFNPLQERNATQTVYIASTHPQPSCS
jgi:spermidine synthase